MKVTHRQARAIWLLNDVVRFIGRVGFFIVYVFMLAAVLPDILKGAGNPFSEVIDSICVIFSLLFVVNVQSRGLIHRLEIKEPDVDVPLVSLPAESDA